MANPIENLIEAMGKRIKLEIKIDAAREIIDLALERLKSLDPSKAEVYARAQKLLGL